MVLASAAAMNLKLRQFDVSTAFLNSKLDEELYMKQPPGYEVKKGDYVQIWGGLFVLEEFKGSELMRDQEPIRIYLAIYVDDGLMAGSDERRMDEILVKLSNKFKITSSANVRKFLGLEISQDRRGFMIHQEDYIQEMAKRFGMVNCKSVGIPLQLYRELTPDPSGEAHDPALPFQEIVGALLFVTRCCRPDVSYAVNKLSRFFQNYEKKHMDAAKEVLRYLRATKDMGIRYFLSQRENKLVGYCDADYGTDKVERKSTTGVIFTFNGSPLTWLSRKQTIIALSTTEAEYVAAATACKEGIWVRNILEDIG
ncbi:unnamed protein product [Allacma fusca]|uniref:Reverse transcriptase Ty1/copia-type domain-containing protein n=1 Tax=Allacma fusca TaxID=39272 RepID=A0A8J2KYX0_9HEXA|nr:unnamed protein product [Allacma fusca]